MIWSMIWFVDFSVFLWDVRKPMIVQVAVGWWGTHSLLLGQDVADEAEEADLTLGVEQFLSEGMSVLGILHCLVFKSWQESWQDMNYSDKTLVILPLEGMSDHWERHGVGCQGPRLQSVIMFSCEVTSLYICWSETLQRKLVRYGGVVLNQI